MTKKLIYWMVLFINVLTCLGLVLGLLNARFLSLIIALLGLQQVLYGLIHTDQKKLRFFHLFLVV